MSSNRTTNETIGILLAAGLLLLAVCIGCRKIRAPDYWWHLSSGEWIAEHLSVPRVDIFTYTVPGAHWLDIHWLFQLGLTGVHRLGGHDGVVIAKTMLVTLIVALLATIGWRRGRPFVTVFGLGLVLLTANDRLLARPELTSFVLFAAILAILERDARRGDAWLYAIIPLQLLWVNTHGLFALGVVLCVFSTMGEAVRSTRGQGQSGRLHRLSILSVITLLTSLANPNFLKGAIYPLEQFGMIAPSGAAIAAVYSVDELTPIWQPGLSLKPFAFALILAVICATALVANWRQNPKREEHALVFLAFFALFSMATRNAALFAIVAGPMWIWNTNQWLDAHPLGRRFSLSCSTVVLFLLVATSFDLARGSYYPRTKTYHEPGFGVVKLFVAEGAADWIERERPPGRIAHSMVTGGYLNWRLYPDYRVMVDGRLEVYGAAKLFELALTGPEAFVRLDQQYQFGSVVLNAAFDSTELIRFLAARADWRLVQLDGTSMVFVRTDSAGDARWPAVDLSAPGLLPEPTEAIPSVQGAYLAIRHRIQGALGLLSVTP